MRPGFPLLTVPPCSRSRFEALKFELNNSEETFGLHLGYEEIKDLDL